MPSKHMLVAVLQHTPPWVWGLLAALLALGAVQARPRRVGPLRAALLPAAMLAWSLWSVAAGFGSGPALLAWTLATLASAAATAGLGAPAGARWADTERAFDLPGSWIPMGLIVGLFGVKFIVGASLALQPALRSDAAFASCASLVFGMFSGVFAGRALALLRLARSPGRLHRAGIRAEAGRTRA